MEHISYKTQTEIVNFQGREIPLKRNGAADAIIIPSAAPQSNGAVKI